MLPDRVFSSGGSAGPNTASHTIVGSTPATQASGELIVIGSARSTDATPFLLYSVALSALGETFVSHGAVQCHTEATHEHQAAWHILASGRRNSTGTSVRTSPVGGGGSGSIANTFTGAKPSIAVSDPASAVAPNVLNRIGIVATGKAGTNILWQYTLLITRSKVL